MSEASARSEANCVYKIVYVVVLDAYVHLRVSNVCLSACSAVSCSIRSQPVADTPSAGSASVETLTIPPIVPFVEPHWQR